VTESDYDGSALCLSFRSPRERISTEYLEVVVGPCKGYESQRWFIKMHEGQLQVLADSQTYPYFSIHSEAFPDKCLTAHIRSVPNNKIVYYYREQDFTPFEALFLTDCNGCNKQSFYIDASFQDIVNDIGSSGAVSNAESFKDLTSSNQSQCNFSDSFDTVLKCTCKAYLRI
jgi:hypothetical protein